MILGHQSVSLGMSPKVTVVPAKPRLIRNDVSFNFGSYETQRFDINPFDIAYRSETKEDYFVDLGYAIGKLAFSYYTGGTDRFLSAARVLALEALES